MWKQVQTFMLGITIGVFALAGVSFAWTAYWHGTTWITTGSVIDATKIAENFEYLYGRVGGDAIPTCTGADRGLQWNGTTWLCVTISTGGTTGGTGLTGSTSLIGGTHTATDCTSAGGSTGPTFDGYLCKFSGSACPAGWTRHNVWTTTKSRYCIGCNGGCHSGQHGFADLPPDTCFYTAKQPYSGKEDPCEVRACVADIIEIGCK